MDKDIKEKMKKEVWVSHNYYQLAEKASLDVNHPGMRILSRYVKDANTILDLGCGEGTRINAISKSNKKATGVDISEIAISLARKRFPKIRFIKADLEEIPLKENNFDLVYSAYVLEHLSNPAKVLSEAIRLLKEGGFLVLIAPNYGAPNRASPPFKGSRIKKLIEGILDDFVNLVIKQDMNWKKIEPIASVENYDVDWDTTIEPYLGSLLSYMKSLNLEVAHYTSCWSEELPNAKIYQKFFRILGELGTYPFKLWGPHLVVVAQKKMKTNNGKQTLESMSQAQWYNKWTLKKIEQFLHGDILEVGCGIGNFTNFLIKYGNVWAIDINKQYVTDAKKKVNGKVKVEIRDVEKGKFFFKGQKFDSIVCLNVLEHIRNDTAVLNNLFGLLKNGGKLILLVPSHQFLYGEIDKSIGHFRRYSKVDLTKKLERLGFKIDNSRRLNFLGAIGWFVAGRVLKENFVNDNKIKVFNIIAPFVLPLEDLLEPPFGTSILIIAQKENL